MTTNDNLSRFERSLLLTLGVFVVCAIFFTLYVIAEKKIDCSNELRQQSFLLAVEFRQSSDDLTRMARSYVITGNPLYKQHYQDILAIRDGKSPRPLNYQDIYWDPVLEDGDRPRPAGEPIALLDLVKQAGFTDREYDRLAQAKAESDALTATDLAAMSLFESQPSLENRYKASLMLHDAAYHQAKTAILQPIGECFRMMEQRTLDNVRAAELAAMRFRLAFIIFGVLLIFMCFRSYRVLNATLGCSVDILHEQIVRLGLGDFSTAIPIGKGMENSVTAWFEETRSKLARLVADYKESEAKNQRLTKLYAALSQCNQAIVRCCDEAELFTQICHDAVVFGGMNMAWIGMLDEQTHLLTPVASFGNGVEYLQGIEISIDEQQVSGRGPTGVAFRENRPCWCRDFQNDPATAPWHRPAEKFGWLASAGLPLQKNGKVIGVFNLYALEHEAFDEAARNLLLEMAMDISHALNGFDLDTERLRAREMENFRTFMLELLTGGSQLTQILVDVVLKLEKILPGSFCSILLLDADGRHLHVAAAPSLPEFYNMAIDGVQIGEGIGSCGNTSYTGKRTIVEDIERHDFWQDFKSLALEAGLHSCWSEPILTAGHKVLGSFAIYHREVRSPDLHEIKLLEMVAHFVALAVERKQAEEHIYHLANFDSLTGLPNRSQLNDHLRYALNLAKRSNGYLALMFLDLDHFKDVNDTLGHSVGDALLIELSARLRRALREEDTVTRLGGDEFIILLPRIDSEGAGHVAQKLLEVIAETYAIDQYQLSLTASIGIALYPDDGTDLESLSKSADAAMYCAKQEGRQGYRYFTPAMQARSERSLKLLNALRQAQENSQFQLYYQPQVSMRDSRIIGAEALLRWRHPELGMVSPAEFIPVAEESGLIVPIGEWVIRCAVRQAKRWLDQGFSPIVIAVNLSAVQFRHPDLPDLVSRILDEADLPAEYLELELTEGVAMHNPQDAIAVIDNLHRRGIRMSIDDFGTGYSSLSYLKKFKVYKLKIDQSFVRDINTDPEDKAIVRAVISLAKSLGLQTIAEGVESVEQLAFSSGTRLR